MARIRPIGPMVLLARHRAKFVMARGPVIVGTRSMWTSGVGRFRLLTSVFSTDASNAVCQKDRGLGHRSRLRSAFVAQVVLS